MKDILEIGQIVNTRGLKGEVKVNSFSSDSKRFEKIDEIYIKENNDLKSLKIQKVTYNKNQVILKLENIDNIDEAEKLRNKYVYVKKSQLEELPEGVYYISDLIGLDVFEEKSNNYLGKVDDIFSTKSNDVYVVKNELGITKLLPGTKDVIKEINLDNKKIIVNLIKGL
ncbi:MAG: ribosome maturation factor RimM [Candidatus Scatovivens sp.]